MAATAAAAGVIGGNSWMQFRGRERKQKRVKICCSSSSLMDSYNTLRIQPGASQSEVKKAFRQLALQVSFLIFLILLFPNLKLLLTFNAWLYLSNLNG